MTGIACALDNVALERRRADVGRDIPDRDIELGAGQAIEDGERLRIVDRRQIEASRVLFARGALTPQACGVPFDNFAEPCLTASRKQLPDANPFVLIEREPLIGGPEIRKSACTISNGNQIARSSMRLRPSIHRMGA